jgi:predicted DNA-binding protein (MmcQ/YjbR family)
MTLNSLRDYLLAKPRAVEEFPFDTVTLVAKVCGKMFGLVSTDHVPLQMNLKCLPEKAEILREQFPAIIPGYHMNKRHWNTVILDGTLPDDFIFSLIDESYELVVQGLPKAKRPLCG